MTNPSIPAAAPAVLKLAPYQSARMLNAFDPNKTYLDANELPVSPPPTAIDYSEMQHYAHAGPRQMIAAYAGYAGVDVSSVVATRGIDEGIDLLIRTYSEPGQDRILIMGPTYGMYAVCAAAHRVETVDLPLVDLMEPDLERLEALDPWPKVIFLCRPNNPTGHVMRKASVEAVLEMARGRSIVAVDEAYIEFCAAETLVPLLKDHPNLVVMRTLSKGFGLAGIHTGFLLAHPQIVDAVNRIANPYPIPEPCAQIALDALSADGLQRLERNLRDIARARAALEEALSQNPNCEHVMPSETNYLLTKWRDPKPPLRALEDAQILPRPVQLRGEAQVRIRISIGTQDDTARVISAVS
ncbi:MAG: histidinol-phosphate transaminase [Pseudomonadota bacterium]